MSNQRKYTLDSLLSKLSCPLLLIWGDLDPWVGPTKAMKIKEFYPNTTVVNLQAGHCPHDEVPELVNKALLDWLSTLKLDASLPETVNVSVKLWILSIQQYNVHLSLFVISVITTSVLLSEICSLSQWCDEASMKIQIEIYMFYLRLILNLRHGDSFS